jgi:hypothetical protein
MPGELFCSLHGPYDAIYSTCPYCSGSYKRPRPPKPLNEDDTQSELGVGQHRSWAEPEEAEIELEAPRSFPRRFLDDDGEAVPVDEPDEDVTQLDITPVGLLGILWVREGSQRGRIHKIEDGTIVGRRGGDLILNDPKVSNPHAKITVEGEQFVIWDFGSKNGTFVNGERIRAATLLNENDIVRLGDTYFVLKVLRSMDTHDSPR